MPPLPQATRTRRSSAPPPCPPTLHPCLPPTRVRSRRQRRHRCPPANAALCPRCVQGRGGGRRRQPDQPLSLCPHRLTNMNKQRVALQRNASVQGDKRPFSDKLTVGPSSPAVRGWHKDRQERPGGFPLARHHQIHRWAGSRRVGVHVRCFRTQNRVCTRPWRACGAGPQQLATMHAVYMLGMALPFHYPAPGSVLTVPGLLAEPHGSITDPGTLPVTPNRCSGAAQDRGQRVWHGLPQGEPHPATQGKPCLLRMQECFACNGSG